jgi:hypothetical protein
MILQQTESPPSPDLGCALRSTSLGGQQIVALPIKKIKLE